MSRALRLAVASGVLAAAPAALASGLYLKLSRAEAGEGAHSVVLTLQAVASRDFTLPQTPLFLLDDGSGMRVAAEVQPEPIDVPETVRVTPEQRWSGSWRLQLPAGAYKVKVRYKLADRTVESNAIRIQVPATAEASR
jgi:hypothetical protein